MAREFDVLSFLEHPTLTLRHLIAPTILRLAETQKKWVTGTRHLAVLFRPAVGEEIHEIGVTFRWALRELEPQSRYNEYRDELRKLKRTMNEHSVTELAALGVAFGLVSVLLPKDAVTRVVPLGGRGDYYLNGRRDEMIEISGVAKGAIGGRFAAKRKQVLLNADLTRAYVSVTGFSPPESRFERVR